MKQFKLVSRYYFSRLCPVDQVFYRTVYDAWVHGGTEAQLEFPGPDFTLPSGLALERLVDYIFNDNPHLFHLEPTQFYFRRLGNKVTIATNSVYTPSEYQQVYRKLRQEVDRIVAGARDLTTDGEKLRYLHDFLVNNVVYDFGARDPRSQREVHTIVGCLLNHACVCDGFSRAFRLLCDRLRLSCIVVIGDSRRHEIPTEQMPTSRHAWNFVKTHKEVFHCDITWDSCLRNGGSVSDYYFLRSDRVFNRDHKWDQTAFPACPRDSSLRPPVIRNRRQLEQAVCSRIMEGSLDFSLSVEDTFPGAERLKYLIHEMIAGNPRLRKQVSSVSFSYTPELFLVTIHCEPSISRRLKHYFSQEESK